MAAEDAAPMWMHKPSTISPEWSDLIDEVGQGRDDPVPSPDDKAGWAAAQAERIAPLEAMADEKAATFNAAYEVRTIGATPVVVVTPSAMKDIGKVAVYVHGGAYVWHSALGTVEVAMLFAARTGLQVYAIDYTLAPHSKFDATTDEVVDLFRALSREGYDADDIVLFGDSAGGSLAAGVTLKMRDLGMQMPAALVLWSPWADITETGDTYVTLRDAEPFYTYASVLGPAARAYADVQDQKHPYVSPVYGDFTKGFPPTLIQGGTKELFVSNFVRLYQALDQAGQVVKLDLYEGMPHVFMHMLPETAESKTALTKVQGWVDVYVLDE